MRCKIKQTNKNYFGVREGEKARSYLISFICVPLFYQLLFLVTLQVSFGAALGHWSELKRAGKLKSETQSYIVRSVAFHFIWLERMEV